MTSCLTSVVLKHYKLTTILQDSVATPMDHWRYRQLAAFVHSLPKPIRPLTELTPVEAALAEPQPVERPISHFYQILQTQNSAEDPAFLYNWEKELQKELSPTQKSTILIMSHISSSATNTAEVNYKLLTRWHYTPALLHKYFPHIPPLCWRGCGEHATHAHIWWSCPLIRPFWLTILHWIKEIQGYEVPNDPFVVLLHCTGKSVGSYRKSITPHLLNAAKALIPRFWKQKNIPTLRQWLMEVDRIYYMEDLTLSLRNKSDYVRKIWSCWFAFKYTSAFAEIMSDPK